MSGKLDEIGAKIDGLGLWEAVAPYNWAVKPKGTVFPYFCTLMKGEGAPVKVRFLMIEGWQTFHDFLRTRIDPNFGFYTTPMEIPHFEMIVLMNGATKVFRHDPGYVPREITDAESGIVERILWESYGVMMRMESDKGLAMKYADEKAVFARVEEEPGKWTDAPLAIPDPRPHVERISFQKADAAAAKDLPFAQEEVLEVDFRIMPSLMTVEKRPRCAYILGAIDSKTGEPVMQLKTSVQADGGLRAMWEGMPARFLKELIARKKIPGEVKVSSFRVFRMLRPLCMELPFKLSMHDSLPRLNATFASWSSPPAAS